MVVVLELNFDKTFLTGFARKKRTCVSVKWNSFKNGGCLVKTGKCLNQKVCQKTKKKRADIIRHAMGGGGGGYCHPRRQTLFVLEW